MRIEIPEFALIAMVGATSSGKTTFALKHFKKTEVLSSDRFRGIVSDDEDDQSASADAFDLLYYAANKRLNKMRTTVIDATNLHAPDRKKVLDIAREQNVHAVAIVLNLPERILQERNQTRQERQYPERVIRKHVYELRRSIRGLRREGFRFVYVLNSPEEIDEAIIERTRMWNNRKELHGPFDVIGDVHGCCDELEELFEKMGYVRDDDKGYIHPENRTAVFVGDLTDRGPRNADTLRLVMKMVNAGVALCVSGNHDIKLLKKLSGRNVQMTHGIESTMTEMETQTEEFREEVKKFLDSLISHYVLDEGRLVVAHAGIKEEYIGRGSGRIRSFCLYGETAGENDEFGLPVRLNWAADYRGRAAVVYGHVPQREVHAVNNTFCIDTGCVFGGKLSAFRYPEKTLVSIDAHREYYQPVKPLVSAVAQTDDETLNAFDVQGKMFLSTTWNPAIMIQENNVAAALEVMSRFAIDPHWLIYLPPTMSPCETSSETDYLEYPTEAFAYYKKNGIDTVVCEKKHMGSRAVIVLCHTVEAAERRFRVKDGRRGVIYTRTGRAFFEDEQVEKELLERLDTVLTQTHFWEDFETDWACFDAELMPWSEKAQVLLRRQYAPVGRSGVDALSAAENALENAMRYQARITEVSANTSGQNVDLGALRERYHEKAVALTKYTDAYREYCWNVRSTNDLRIAPFHLLAVEGLVFGDQKHVWHMETLKKYCTGVDDVFMATDYMEVNVTDDQAVAKATEWWINLTASGGEGMVVKPESYIVTKSGELLQPAVKCRGREYLRIIYGPEYLAPEHLVRLKKRGLGRKRSLALREFALGMEALKRFVAKEPLYRIHECVFGVLAFESEPVDPRL